ncbi:MAG: Flp family type IVb pilin [Moritella sp.]|uniref:Flp family type IVb pilin n=1 Tax=Moritella sp. TaxID=78556 RepID=UPI000C0CB80E|nr:Flp family type IVb pilin [Moritella sp.]MBL1416265.1 Flp family type IVb pilin [Moritella sp.]PHR89306.1 MAG: Flp family type IVb pilin [Moritella sp.]
MNKLSVFIQDFIKDESGLTAVEYAIAGGLVVGGMVTAFSQLGTSATGQITTLCAAVDATATCTGVAATP